MKREDAKNKIPGITEEQLNWLMQENGSDITREKFLSTLSLRRATHRARMVARSPLISIHALLAESDAPGEAFPRFPSDFYPRSPCGERRAAQVKAPRTTRFLSTLSLRRAT